MNLLLVGEAAEKWAVELALLSAESLPDEICTRDEALDLIEVLVAAVAGGWARRRHQSESDADAFFQNSKARAAGYIVAVIVATLELADNGTAGLDKVMSKWGN